MTLAKGACPRATFLWLAPILVGAGLLAGCQSGGHPPPPEVRTDAWRVVERVGEARYLAPGASSWAAALAATALPDGSRVATGAGGRLILARITDHVSAGPDSAFSLPDAAGGTVLEQIAGHLQYRLAEAGSLAVATPALTIEAGGKVFDVTVSAEGTEVAVEGGRLRVATLDGQRQIELEAGQSAHAGGPEALAYRRARGQPLERVGRIILPSLQPKPAVTGGQPESSPIVAPAAAKRASTPAAASVESAVPIATASPTVPVAPLPLAARPATTGAEPTREDGIVPEHGPAASEIEPAITPAPGISRTAANESPATAAPGVDPAIPAPSIDPAGKSDLAATPAPGANPTGRATGDDRRRLFDRLTEGVIDAVPAQTTPHELSAHARSI